jgi:hypothetical protein
MVPYYFAHLRLIHAPKIILLIFALLGFLTFDMVYIFAIMNYVIQAEMNVYLIWDIRKLIEAKKHDSIDGAIKVCSKSSFGE